MSLGLGSPWRARSCIGRVQGLPLVPRESRNLLFATKIQARCWLSTSAESSFPESPFSESPFSESPSPGSPSLVREPARRRGDGTSFSAARRRDIRHTAKHQVVGPLATALIKPAVRYPSPQENKRALRKEELSTRKQARHEYARNSLGKLGIRWQTTLDRMIRHSPKFGDILDFKVGIGRGAAAQARANLSELDTNLWQIQQRHLCKIHVESGAEAGEPLVLSLSGRDASVQQSLLEIVRAVGKVSGVRVLDSDGHISSSEFWESRRKGQPSIRLLSDGESASEDDIVTVYGRNDEFIKMAKPPNHKPYKLTMRADQIPRPPAWTKTSFEKYVAELVLARVPTHLHNSLYPVGPDHQTTVVELLTELFSSEDVRPAVSVAALKLALRFMQARGPMFRPAARILFYQVQLQRLRLDAEVFEILLTSASKAGDLDAFNSVLGAMHRNGHYVRAPHWTAFLTMIQDPESKLHIMRRMRSRGLHHLPPVSEQLGRQKIMLHLHRLAGMDIDIQSLLQAQDEEYGPSWLNTVTLNRMIDVIGAQGNHGACHELLDFVDHHGRARPDHYTLNTMITHTPSVTQKIALLSRWPELKPDGITYSLLFQAAWTEGLPNMLRVVWRYSALAGLTNARMRHNLTKLMAAAPPLSSRKTFLKAWEDVIFGRSELAASRLPQPDDAPFRGAAWLRDRYLEEAGHLRPLLPLTYKLEEAHRLDMKIHEVGLEEGVTTGLKESLTISIPLGRKRDVNDSFLMKYAI